MANEYKVSCDMSLLTDQDIYLFREGTHYRLYEKLGSHFTQHNGTTGVYFAVWAPNAVTVTVVGDFNNWNPAAHPLRARQEGSGIWEGFISGLEPGCLYKYHIVSAINGYTVNKSDPYAFYWEQPPNTASRVWDLPYEWNDIEWMRNRETVNALDKPMSIYELHPGSWRRDPARPEEYLTYRELAPLLVEYIKEMGFTHVEFTPLMEHPFFPSWGYQTVGYFAPTSRFGTPQDCMYMIDLLHRNGIGVILDWVPAHFPTDEHGPGYFDGTHLYEHADQRQGFHPDWKTFIFNYGRNEVRAFLISSAVFWLDRYHADGLRVDGVASMLYLNYSREDGEWVANERGGNENLEAIEFLRQLNSVVYRDFPGVQTIAEESTSWPMVTRPTEVGGLGFGLKWNMGWMHDTLKYCSRDPIYRRYHHNQLTFSIWYAFHENFVLPLSHDEVVHGKGSIYGKLAGDPWQKFAGLRLLYGYMYTHPGKKMLFMGDEFGQTREWNFAESLDWHLLAYDPHKQLQEWIRDLNAFYKSHPPLYEKDFVQEGFEWIDLHDVENSVICFLRKGIHPLDRLAVICNFTPTPRFDYHVGVPEGGPWDELLNSDARQYGGSGLGNMGRAEAVPSSFGSKFRFTLKLTLPPLGILVFRRDRG